MVSWTAFKSELVAFFEAKTAQNFREAAQKIASLYANAVSNAELDNGNRLISVNTGVLENELFNAFTSMFNNVTKDPPVPAVFTPIATGFVNAWEKSRFEPNPPMPPTVDADLGVVVESGGSISPITNGLHSAFTANDGSLAVDRLVDTFKAHLQTVEGYYDGYVIEDDNKVKSPPIYWKGVK